MRVHVCVCVTMCVSVFVRALASVCVCGLCTGARMLVYVCTCRRVPVFLWVTMCVPGAPGLYSAEHGQAECVERRE